MSAGAILMMCVACIGLWGGFATACIINFKHSKRKKQENKQQ